MMTFPTTTRPLNTYLGTVERYQVLLHHSGSLHLVQRVDRALSQATLRPCDEAGNTHGEAIHVALYYLITPEWECVGRCPDSRRIIGEDENGSMLALNAGDVVRLVGAWAMMAAVLYAGYKMGAGV